MALNINGTTGISVVDGSASAPVFTGNDSNTGISFGSDIVNINTGGVTRATLESNGRFGLGLSSPDTPFHLRGSGFTTFTMDNAGNTSTPYKITYGDQGQVNHLAVANREMTFGTNNLEHMRVTNTGRLLIGSTSVYSDNFIGNGIIQFDAKQANRNAMTIRAKNSDASAFTTSNVCAIGFVNGNGVVGQISVSGSATSYLTSSDYRLKENAVAISDGITRLKTLKPYRFNFKADANTTVDGFFAHEVTAVPEAISGTKDEVDSDDNILPQGIDQSKLVPLLTAALQEAVGKIEVLETKVAALEAA